MYSREQGLLSGLGLRPVYSTTNSNSYLFANTMQEIIEKHKNVLYSIHTIELKLAYSIYRGR